ncbi:DUF2145 domain-containing protein [uncultured Paraglaciecola sp.]|uniref:DUF2145 domain-containing protein n=1 Tax=uncultured Paraglaciecola sp. TaxID=1765024 RepID=UPI0030DBC5A3|tara:strand:+ start:13009 stop:13803 length:795 start_codon:yes stop_codon:yes gene_type:complete
MKTKLIFTLLALLCAPSWAGSETNKQSTLEPEKIVKFAKDVEKYAAAKGARAFIIARVGRPEKELPKGIHYTHTAIAVYSDIQLKNGETAQGYAIHNLYQRAGKPNRSQLVQDYPVDFFWGAHTLKAGIIIPSEEIQTRLIELITSGKNAELHNPKYSVIANPMNSQLQNCTEHTLDMLNAAIYQSTDIEKLKANTRAYYTAQRVRTSRFKLLFGAMLMDEVTTKDHPGKIATATFGSIHTYLDQYQLAQHGVTFYADGKTNML